MKNFAFSTSKLGKILAVFSEEEFFALKRWLQSPWAGASKKALAFYRLLSKYYPGFNSRTL